MKNIPYMIFWEAVYSSLSFVSICVKLLIISFLNWILDHSDGDFSLRLILSSTSIINNLSVWYMLICWLILIIKSKILCRWSESWETNKQLLFWDLIVDYTRRWARYAIVNYLGGPATKSFEGSPKFLREEYSLMQVSNG